MTYLGMNIDGAMQLVAELRRAAATADEGQGLVAEAALLGDFGWSCGSQLGEVADTLRRSAAHVTQAMATLLAFRLTRHDMVVGQIPPPPVRTPVPILSGPQPPAPPASAQWNASPFHDWNQVTQVASHNTYEVHGGVATLFDRGVRSFEIDIHDEPPLLWRRLFGLPHDTAGTGSGAHPDWHVYHISGFGHREYDTLAEGLQAVAALDTTDPLTIFVDNKDQFELPHDAAAFDHLLHTHLGDRLYTPSDLLERAPGAVNLQQAISVAGWPAVRELQGRVLVVVTDETESYHQPEALAFVAPPPRFVQSGTELYHDSSVNAVFYNADAADLSAPQVQAVQSGGNLLRTYFNPVCPNVFDAQGLTIQANYRAIDVPADSHCPTSAQMPTRVPEPEPTPTADSGS